MRTVFPLLPRPISNDVLGDDIRARALEIRLRARYEETVVLVGDERDGQLEATLVPFALGCAIAELDDTWRKSAVAVFVRCLDGPVAQLRASWVSDPGLLWPFCEGVSDVDVHGGVLDLGYAARRCLFEELGVPLDSAAATVTPAQLIRTQRSLIGVFDADVDLTFTELQAMWASASHADEGSPELIDEASARDLRAFVLETWVEAS